MPRADNNAATVRPPIPPPTTTTSYPFILLHLIMSLSTKRSEHDKNRLNPIEDEMNDKGRKHFA